MYDIFRERGNLVSIFSPRDTELTPDTNHIEISAEELKEKKSAKEREKNLNKKLNDLKSTFGF